MKQEWRVVWRREGYRRKERRYKTELGAKRFLLLLTDPAAYCEGQKYDRHECCDGRECGCRGISKREAIMGVKAPPLLWAFIETAEVSWVAILQVSGRVDQ